jgi:hypothetical protein
MKVYRIVEDYGGYDGGEVTLAVFSTREGAEAGVARAMEYAKAWKELIRSGSFCGNHREKPLTCRWAHQEVKQDSWAWDVHEHEVWE